MHAGKEKFAHGIIVRMFRIWTAGRAMGAHDLPRMQEIAEQLRLPDETALACASLFELIEGRLGRVLMAECCCSQQLSADEQALLTVVSLAPAMGPAAGTAVIPHGLPGAIVWAAITVRRAFGIEAAPADARAAHPATAGCPFDHAGDPGHSGDAGRAEAAHGF